MKVARDNRRQSAVSVAVGRGTTTAGTSGPRTATPGSTTMTTMACVLPELMLPLDGGSGPDGVPPSQLVCGANSGIAGALVGRPKALQRLCNH
jgi:hypothetical protein